VSGFEPGHGEAKSILRLNEKRAATALTGIPRARCRRRRESAPDSTTAAEFHQGRHTHKKQKTQKKKQKKKKKKIPV